MENNVKICIVCGREIEWRKKWQRNWDTIKYCSRSCRKARISEIDRKLEKAILRLLHSRSNGKTICPSEAAKAIVKSDSKDQWYPLMEAARRAARRLAHKGYINIVQSGKIVDPSRFRGPVRIELKSYQTVPPQHYPASNKPRI